MEKFTIGLNDAMMNLDKPITVYRGDSLIFEGHVQRLQENIEQDINAMRDGDLLFPVKLYVDGYTVSETTTSEPSQPRSFMKNTKGW